ncbi:MAG: hypothetical protein HYV09_15235 [Deltaproteobacteria bacterium]|nr:hypothetical protein [Deltaproteobacteria bacterium]
MRTSLDTIVRELVRAEIAELREQPFGWVSWRQWARSCEHARRIADREGIRTTKIGRDVYGLRADLDALAARNAVEASRAPAREEVDPEIAAAFGAEAR